MSDDKVLIVGIGLLALYLLSQKGSAAQTGAVQTFDQTPACSRGGVDMCSARKVGGDIPITDPTPASSAPTNTFCQGGQIIHEGLCINPESRAPRLGSAVNDATLAMIIRQQEAANQAGNWDLAWQIAEKRDAWIKQQGY